MKKFILFIITFLFVFPFSTYASTVSEQRNAVLATADAYYAQGVQLQYDSFRKALYSTPEDATSKHMVYTVCSGFTYMTYYQALGVKLPDTTDELLNYARDNQGSSNVIFYYGSKDAIYKSGVLGTGSSSVTSAEKQAFVDSIINKVKPGDVFVYASSKGGHAVLVKSVDTKNKKITIIESTGDEYHYANHVDVLDDEVGTIVINDFLTELRANKDRMALIRVITNGTTFKDGSGNVVSYDITDAARTRMKYTKIDVGKIINNVDNQFFAGLGDELTYQLRIRNKGNITYKNISVVENVDSNLEIVNAGGGSVNGKNISWTISSIAPGEYVTLLYTVRVPKNNNLIGTLVVSTGKVGGIATSKIETRIGKRLSSTDKAKVKASFDKLKGKENVANTSRRFINTVYKDALGIDLGIYSVLNLSVLQYDPNAKTAGGSKFGVKYTWLDSKMNKYLYSNYYGLRIGKDFDASNHIVRAFNGWNVYATRELNDRARNLTPSMLEDGDVILAYIGRTSTTDTSLGNKGFLYLDGTLYMYKGSPNSFDKITGEELKSFLNNLMGENYIILRPHLKSMTGISVSKVPTKNSYTQNSSSLDLTGGEITVNYDDGSSEKVSLKNSNVKVSGFNSSTFGVKTITVEYNGYKSTFNVEVVERKVKNISMGKIPTKTKYVVGIEQLDLTGGEITVSYDDGSSDKINLKNNKVKVSGFNNSKVGKNTITVEYAGLRTNYSVEIIKNSNDKRIALESKPIKTVYYYGEEKLDLTGGVISIIQSDGKIEKISLNNKNVKVSGFDNKKLGINVITVEYEGYSLQFNVEVVNKKVISIVVSVPPTKVNYIASLEQLDLTGGVITVTYEDGTVDTMSLNSSDVEVSGFNNGVVGSNNLIIQYRGVSTSLNVNVFDKKISSISVSSKPTKVSYICNKEQLDLTGGVITITYDDGTFDTMSLVNENVKVSGFDNSKIGFNNVTVEYNGYKSGFDVEIIDGYEAGNNNSMIVMIIVVIVVIGLLFGGAIFLKDKINRKHLA